VGFLHLSGAQLRNPQTNIVHAEERPIFLQCARATPRAGRGLQFPNETTHRDDVFPGCGVGSYRAGQPLGSDGDTYAYTKSDAHAQD
jgi:hypothetical protein